MAVYHYTVSLAADQLTAGTHQWIVWSMESLRMCGRKLPAASLRSFVHVICVGTLRCGAGRVDTCIHISSRRSSTLVGYKHKLQTCVVEHCIIGALCGLKRWQ